MFAHHEQEVKEKVYKGTLLQFGGVSSQCQGILGEFKGPSQGNKNSSTIFLELKGKAQVRRAVHLSRLQRRMEERRHEVYHTAAGSCTGVLAELLWRKEVQSVRENMLRTQKEGREEAIQ